MSDRSQSKDTGRDCPYCGGVIYRVENDNGNVTTAFHNCRMCGARWSDNWSLTSPGNSGFSTRKSFRGRNEAESESREPFKINWPSFDLSQSGIPSWGWILIVVVGAYILIRIGFASLLNFLSAPLMVIILGYIVFKIGKEQRWW